MTAIADHPVAPAMVTYSPALGRSVQKLVLAIGTLTTCMEFVTSYALGVALPDVQGDLSASFDEGSWILTTYTTCWLVGLMFSNWLTARIGYGRSMIAMVVLYMTTAVGCGLSHTLTEMLVFRGAMGFAGGTFLCRGQAAINLAFLGMDRFKALLVFGLCVVGVARLCGAGIGGFLTEWYSWRAIFFLNVPLSLTALALLTAVPDVKARLTEAQSRFDLAGILLLIGWLAPLQIALSRGERDDWFADPFITVLFATAACCLPLFVWWESRRGHAAALVSLRTFKSRTFVIGSVYVLILGMMLYGQLYVVPQFLRNVQHHSAWGTGLLQSFNAAAFTVGLIAGAHLIKRLGLRLALGAGAAAFTAGMWCWATRLTPQISDTAMLLPLFLTGLGSGWQIGPLSILINRDTPPALMGEGMELYLCLRQLGGSWGIAVLAALVDRRRSFWSGRLGEHVNDYELHGQVDGDVVGQGMALLQAAGVPGSDAHAGAMGLVHARLQLQSIVNAFKDTFAYQAALGVTALALVVALGRGRMLSTAFYWIAQIAR
jgi:DHA2 family multidrug resistance protein